MAIKVICFKVSSLGKDSGTKAMRLCSAIVFYVSFLKNIYGLRI